MWAAGLTFIALTLHLIIDSIANGWAIFSI
jgi:hypothetical protein